MSAYRPQSGNVLFLILIAVALFAALSYAVTQSTRTNGANADEDKAALIASQIVQMAAAVKTARDRLVVGEGYDQARFSIADAADAKRVLQVRIRYPAKQPVFLMPMVGDCRYRKYLKAGWLTLIPTMRMFIITRSSRLRLAARNWAPRNLMRFS